ncbi:hypothetical protein EVJ58_g6982 [Rhodofomes roseus]|uniref:Reverse transcriptase domain-containing protein n=1 Tax=Rhodofomes roseus TaxID=34475 RepID=A0A4Y9Y7H5_9APHY|nr:hypothetical protein EVJ58_g6982 [Rhodofomes roseus]
MHGPFPAPPLADFRCSPLGTVTRKRKPGKFRVINHLSWPDGTSVNDGIADHEAYIAYESFDKAVSELARLGPGTLLAKLDLKDAFRHIPVRPQDWHLLGCQWRGSFYYYITLVFGLKTAPYIFNMFAEALHWIIQRHIPASLKHYLDDFMPMFRPGTTVPYANSAVDWVMALGDSLGLRFQHNKTVRPCTSLEFLGLELDSVAMEARLPHDKLSYLRDDLLPHWSAKHRCTLHELQELIGFLQFTTQVIPHSRAFIQRLIDFSRTFRSPYANRHIPNYARADLTWWRTFVPAWNGIRAIVPSRPVIHVYTDASGTKGIGGVFGMHWFASRVPRRFRGTKRDIQFKELYAVVQAALRWGEDWRQCHVVFHIDNEVIVNAIETERNRSRHTMSLLRLLLMLAACLDFSFSSSWLPSKANALADAASRFQYSRLFELAPCLDRKTSSPIPHLSGLKRTLTTLDNTGQKSFIDFARLHPAYLNADGSFLPASQRAVMEWVAYLGGRALQPKTIKSYVSALRSLHVDADMPFDVCESPVVQRLIRGIKRYHGERERNPKMPITLAVLQQMSAALPSPAQSAGDASFAAAIKTAFAGFLRCGEFTVDRPASFTPATSLTRGSVQFFPSLEAPAHVLLSLPSSKTDPFRRGVSVLIAAAPGTSTCAVAALQHLFTVDPRSPTAPLFVADDGSPLTRSNFITRLKLLLPAAGLDPTGYSGHSFRRGAASSAAAAGYSDFEIQQLGRWRSDAYRLYIDIPRDRVLHLSSRLHWADPHAQPFEPPALPFAPRVA